MFNWRNPQPKWWDAQRALIESLSGSIISEWRGVEMAFGESADSAAAIWRHPSIDVLQCTDLDANVNGSWLRFTTDMGDRHDGPLWGIVATSKLGPLPFAEPGTSSFYRKRDLNCLPIGRIDGVSCIVDSSGPIGEVHLRIAGTTLELRAAEVYQVGDDDFRTHVPDESLLLRVDGRHPENPPRTS